MKTVYFVRHGESTANARTQAAYLPDRDVPLSERGLEQSRFIAARAAKLPLELIIASPYKRTVDTARMITEATGLEPEYSELFVERQLPDTLVGLPLADPAADTRYREWLERFYRLETIAEDKEDFPAFMSRAHQALTLLEGRPESHIMVVTHGMFLRAILAVMLFGPSCTIDTFRSFVAGTVTRNTGITVCTHGVYPHHDIDQASPRWRMTVFNDHAHLA
jgi:probable phosphoglycerate mutase